jgi:hypothetical protein
MPVPQIERFDLAPIENAVSTYLAVARDFTANHGSDDVTPKRRKMPKATGEDSELPLDASEAEKLDAESVARERRRALHWRVDAEVLKLYALPPALFAYPTTCRISPMRRNRKAPSA